MTVIVLDSGAKFEVREGKLFLKEDDSYKQIERIERLVEILNGSESVDVIFRLDSGSICFEIERKIQRIDNEERYVLEEYPVFVILLLHEFKQFKLSIEKTSCILAPRRKFKEKEILEIINNASCAWLAVDLLYPFGRLIDYFTDPEIFVKNRLERGDLFNDFQTRLEESKTRLEEFKSENSIPERLELVVFTMNRIEELLDFFLEFTEILNKIKELSELDISKIFIFPEFLRRFERLTKNFLGLMIHVISRLVFGKKLVSLQLFSILTDVTGELTYETIASTARNIFDIDNLFKLEQDQRKNLLHLISKWGEAKEFKRLRNVSPLSHRFKPVDLSGYTAEKIIEILSPFHNFLINLLYDNIKIIKKRVESEEDEKLQNEMALVGVSTDDVWDYIYQLEYVLSTISKFTPSELVKKLKYLRNLYLNLFLFLSFFEEVKMEVIK